MDVHSVPKRAESTVELLVVVWEKLRDVMLVALKVDPMVEMWEM